MHYHGPDIHAKSACTQRRPKHIHAMKNQTRLTDGWLKPGPVVHSHLASRSPSHSMVPSMLSLSAVSGAGAGALPIVSSYALSIVPSCALSIALSHVPSHVPSIALSCVLSIVLIHVLSIAPSCGPSIVSSPVPSIASSTGSLPTPLPSEVAADSLPFLQDLSCVPLP